MKEPDADLVAAHAETQVASDALAIANQALAAANLDLAEAQRLAHVGSWSVDVTTGRLTWSDELFRIFGLEPGGPVPSAADRDRQYPPEMLAVRDRLVRESLETGKGWDLEYDLRRPDGSIRRVHARGEGIRNATGAIVGLRGTLADVTEAHAAREARARRLARRADYLSRVEHVLRTDLSIVTGWAGMLAEGYDAMGSEERREAIEAIHRNAQTLVSHVQALMSQAAETVEADLLELGPVDVATIARAAASDYAGLQRDIAVSAIADDGLRAQGSVSALETVLRHLLENGIRHARSEVTIRVAAAPDDRTVELTVTDDGPGLPDGQAVFEPFAPVGDGAGHGLGLHVVRTLVEGMAGEVAGRNRSDGPGAIFTVRLPVPEA